MYPEPICTEFLSVTPDLLGECGAECEILLPDYCPNILRILQSTVTLSIQTQTVGTDRITVEGKADFRILYLAEDGSGMKCATQQTPFSGSVERKSADDASFFLSASPRSCTARALNSRKIFARCTVQINAAGDGNKMLPNSIAFDPYEQKTCRIQTARLLRTAEKPLRISDEFETENRNVAAILQQRVSFRETEQRPLTDKLIVKADMILDLLCAEEDGSIFPLRKTIPVSQILDLPNTDSESTCHVLFDLISFNLTVSEEEIGSPHLSYDTEIRVFCKAYTTGSAEWTEDAFSVKKQLECEKKPIAVDRFLRISERESLQETVEIGTCSDILWAEMIPQKKSICYDKENKRILCEGSWDCRLLVTDAEGTPETVTREIPFTLSCPWEEDVTPVRNDTELILSDLSWSMTDAEHGELRGTYEWNGLIFTRNEGKTVTEIKEIADRPRSEDTVVLYYAAEGESVWEIAKEHACHYEELLRENGESGDRITEDKMLMILR